ncbi:glycoside hydrolase family 15 protein [Kitasatospora aureofaciens]|uniref:glycoside hydrolase family 15 protein n=1 Tax=Kitasatospora aureofaciens TaxID=1894 RepID=UPI001C48B2B1|nr:glycoside hydrolase family 15 protein [Kitasatospora aureofaciens]MBV6695681.1 glycoside hydrolase family 15 protein [Kitasatospora aureofaciens]
MPTPAALRCSLIEDHGFIGNTATGALVRRDGTINWLCLPRFDSPAVFAALLGTDEHGFWRIGPTVDDAAPPADRRRYRGDTVILEQEWVVSGGSVRVTDFMPSGSQPAQVVRIVEGLKGTVAMTSLFRPRPGYGADNPLVTRIEHNGTSRLCATVHPDSYWLDGTYHTVTEHGARADFTVTAGESVTFSLTWCPSFNRAPDMRSPRAALTRTAGFWLEWASRCTYQGPYREAVLRSALALKSLCHPGGGIVAAPTTSLPEDIGGERNWDYRYTWLRDAALTITTLARLGYTEEAEAWRDWLLGTLGRDADRLQIMYGLGGERDLAERELDHLPGYENSRPVRVGNGAAGQLQLDVPGEVADALLAAENAGLHSSRDADAMLCALARWTEERWSEPDEGIWEVRGPRRHFVHSKVMAWAAIDRTITLLRRRPSTSTDELANWVELREAIHADVCTKGYDPERNTFTQYYGGRELDASLLLIPQVGFLPPDDKRVIGTIEAIQRELSTEDGFVLRYPTHDETGSNVDGLSGHEGAFLACSFWLADDLAMIGRVQEARELFDKLLALRNDLGLLAEEWDPRAKRQLGNFPQAFSHVALADTAMRLTNCGAHLPGQRDRGPVGVLASARP